MQYQRRQPSSNVPRRRVGGAYSPLPITRQGAQPSQAARNLMTMNYGGSPMVNQVYASNASPHATMTRNMLQAGVPGHEIQRRRFENAGLGALSFRPSQGFRTGPMVGAQGLTDEQIAILNGGGYRDPNQMIGQGQGYTMADTSPGRQYEIGIAGGMTRRNIPLDAQQQAAQAYALAQNDNFGRMTRQMAQQQGGEQFVSTDGIAGGAPPYGSPASSPMRTWNDASGQFSAQASMIGRDQNSVTIQRADTGEIVQVPLDKLSSEDLDFVGGGMPAAPGGMMAPRPIGSIPISGETIPEYDDPEMASRRAAVDQARAAVMAGADPEEVALITAGMPGAARMAARQQRLQNARNMITEREAGKAAQRRARIRARRDGLMNRGPNMMQQMMSRNPALAMQYMQMQQNRDLAQQRLGLEDRRIEGDLARENRLAQGQQDQLGMQRERLDLEKDEINRQQEATQEAERRQEYAEEYEHPLVKDKGLPPEELRRGKALARSGDRSGFDKWADENFLSWDEKWDLMGETGIRSWSEWLGSFAPYIIESNPSTGLPDDEISRGKRGRPTDALRALFGG